MTFGLKKQIPPLLDKMNTNDQLAKERLHVLVSVIYPDFKAFCQDWHEFLPDLLMYVCVHI